MVKFRYIVVILACLCLIGTIALAQILLKSIPVTVNVVEGIKAIEVYSDPGLTQILDYIDLGDMGRGASYTSYFYIKNIGDESLNIDLTATGVNYWAVASFGPTTPFFLSPGSSASCWIRLDVMQTAELVAKTFNMQVLEVQ